MIEGGASGKKKNRSPGLTTFPDKNAAENGIPFQNTGRLTTLRESNAAENGEPQLQNKRGES